MRAPALCLATLLAAPPALAAEGGPIRGGEHPGFTRIVLEVAPTTEWSLDSGDGRAILTFPARSIAFTTAGVFERIPRSRLTAVETAAGPGGTSVSLALGCDCRVSASFVGARFLALDIADRAAPIPAPPAAPDEARARREAQAVADAEDALVRQITRAASQGLVRFTDAAAARQHAAAEAAATEAAEPAAAEPAAAEPAAAATEPAATRGDPARPLPRPRTAARPEARPEARAGHGGDARLTRTALAAPGTAPLALDGLIRHEQISASTVFDRDSRQARDEERPKPLPGACLPDDALDLSRWSDGTAFADQLAGFRSRLVGEFDQPDATAVEGAARLYIRFGLGAEAAAMLAAFPDLQLADRAILLDLARAVDDEPVAAGGPLATDAECPGLHAVWLAAGGAVPVWRSTEGFDAIQAAFGEMPTELRALLAPRLVRRLVDAGRIGEARIVYLITIRSGETPGPALQLAEARLAAAEGRSADAVRTMARLAQSNEASISADALADLVRVALDAHLAIPEPIAIDLATASLLARGSARDARLRGLLAETLARRSDLTGALAELRRARADLPAQAAVFDALSVRLISETDPATIGRAVYAEAALGAEALIVATPAADPSRATIAGRLVELGLPDPAIRLIGPGLAAGDEAARIVAARAEIARGDGAAARAALGPLASTAAVELRAEAYARSGEYDQALATLDAAGLDTEAARYAWASGDWARAGEAAAATNADRAAMARYMAARAGAPAAAPAADGTDPADAEAIFAAPLPSLDRPSLGAARRLLATGAKIGGVVESAIAEP